MGTNTTAGLGGLATGLQSENTGNGLLQLAALLVGSQQHAQNVLQVRQALAQQHAQATQAATQQAEIQKRIETEATTRAAELVKIEKEKWKQKSSQDVNATKPDD